MTNRKKQQPIAWRRREKRGARLKKKMDWGKAFTSIGSILRKLFLVFVILFVCGLPYFAWIYLNKEPVFTIERVVVHQQYSVFSSKELNELVGNAVGQNFVSFDVNEYRQNILTNPWVKDVDIKRHWFSELEIFIEERVPVAIWNEDAYIEADGDIFKPERLDYKNYVQIKADDNERKEMLSYLQLIENELEKIDLKVAVIEYDYMGAWTIELRNGLKILLGSSDFHDRFLRFINYYKSTIEEKLDTILSVDFRYKQGYAVKWKPSKLKEN